jgi:nucleoside-diphosphate-sugar epimerase
LITGSSGFIGSFLVEEGIRRGYQVFAGIRESSSRRWLNDPSIRLVRLDLSSIADLTAVFKDLCHKGIQIDYLIHNAGVTRVRRKEDFHRVNAGYTLNLLQAITASGLDLNKILYMSSLAAYGGANQETGEPVKLSDRPSPVGEYGRSKLEAERYIRESGIPWLILRPTGVYGPRERDYLVFFRTIRRGLEPYLGTRNQWLTFIYVKDLARFVFQSLESHWDQKAWFVSDGMEYTAVEFTAMVKQILQKRTVSLVIPAWMVRILAYTLEHVYGWFGTTPTLNHEKYKIISVTDWRCETTPLFSDLGIKPEYDLRRGLEETLRWYQANGWL